MIKLEKVNKWYGAHHVLKDVDLSVARGEVLVVCGPSGSGKSTMIRTINRLEPIEKGRILIDDADIYGKGVNLNALRQKIGFVFQQFNLFPHMSVLDNVVFAPVNIRKQPRKQATELARQLLARVGLRPEHAQRFPHQFSGGQRQRIAIARALALEPRFIIADEAVSALDVSVKAQVLDLLADLQAEQGLTYLFISHDLGVVRHFADRVAIMAAGELVEEGECDRIFEAPAQDYTRRLIAAVPRPDPSRRRLRQAA